MIQPIPPQPIAPRPILTVPVQPRPLTVVSPQPQPVQSSPQPHTVPRNTVVAGRKFSLNPQSNPVEFNLDSTQAETDARQLVEAGDTKRMLDTAMGEKLAEMPDSPEKREMLTEWRKIVSAGGKTEDVQAFLDRFGPPPGNNKLPGMVVEFGQMRQDFANYADKLNTGAFTTPEERDQALADLQSSLTTFNGNGVRPDFAATLQEKMNNMQNYNTLGKLAVATAESENPYPILIQGATQADMPLAFVSEMTGYPVMGVEPIGEQTTPQQTAAAPVSITIANPEGNAQVVAYRLGTYDYTMSSGELQTLDRSYVCSFDNGAGVQKSYTLGNGYYEWRLDPATGWDLVQAKVTVVIDNSRYDGSFEYLLQGQPQTIASGEVAEFTHVNLIDVAFHSGREGLEHYKRLKPGVYIVGLDPEYGALDLFPAAKVEAFEAKQPPFPSSTELFGSRASKAQRVEALLAQIKKNPGAQPANKDTAVKPAEVSAAKRGVSPLGKKAPAQSAADLLKAIKPKAASSATPEEKYQLFEFIEGQPGGPFPVKDDKGQIITVPAPGLGEF